MQFTFCVLPIKEHTSAKDVCKFLYEVFEDALDMEVAHEIIAVVEHFKTLKEKGNLTYSFDTGLIEVKSLGNKL